MEALHVQTGTRSDGESWSDSISRTHPSHSVAGDVSSFPRHCLASHTDWLHSHSDHSHRVVANAVKQWNPVISHWRCQWNLGGRLDYLLGGGHLQYTEADGSLRHLQKLVGRAGNRRCARPGDFAGLGPRRVAGRSGWLRLSLGSRCPNPGCPGRGRTGRAARGSDSQQRPGLLWCTGSADYRAGSRNQLAAVIAVGLGREDCSGAGTAASLGADLPGHGPQRIPRWLAAGGSRVIGLHPGPVAGLAIPGAISS